MAITAAEVCSHVPLATVRRFEAAGFRAWPATSVHYDGTWAIRLTASHPAKRLNSINPLDPADTIDIVHRVARASARFAAYDRPVTFRISPLAGQPITDFIEEEGWTTFGESLVMAAPIGALPLADAIDHLPVRDIATFSSALIAVRNSTPLIRAGISEVIGAIEPDCGMFLLDSGGRAASTAIAVADGDLAGLFEVATAPEFRRKGMARRSVLSALRWARARGASTAWLQVEAGNEAALNLYRSLGFTTIYRYHYCRAAGGTPR